MVRRIAHIPASKVKVGQWISMAPIDAGTIVQGVELWRVLRTSEYKLIVTLHLQRVNEKHEVLSKRYKVRSGRLIDVAFADWRL